MKSSKINFIASVKDDQVDNIKVIAKKLKSLGCVIDNINSFSGIITGSTSTTLADLKIDGIKHVEIDRDTKAI